MPPRRRQRDNRLCPGSDDVIPMDRQINEHIRVLDIGADTGYIADVIRASFATVARRFDLTPSNCPAHPAFLETDKLAQMQQKGAQFLGLTTEGRLAGLVAVKIRDQMCHIEKLAVLPECRHRGFGKTLMEAAEDYARERGCEKASIGIIDENKILKDWYIGMGFGVAEIKEFAHLPFRVCFMDKLL